MEWLDRAFFSDASEGKVAEKRKRRPPAQRGKPGCSILWQQEHPSLAIQTSESCAGTCKVSLHQPIFQLCTPPRGAFHVCTRVDVPPISLEISFRRCPAPYSRFSDTLLPIDLAHTSPWPVMATTHPPNPQVSTWQGYYASYPPMRQQPLQLWISQARSLSPST
jgi:hypothetical protein